jgi:transcriptional regulator GlxA family with amidase domain
MTAANALRAAMDENDLTPEDVASKLGLSARTVTRMFSSGYMRRPYITLALVVIPGFAKRYKENAAAA